VNRFLPSLLTPIRILFFCLAAPPLLAVIILITIIDNTAITQKNWPLTQSDIQRAKSIIDNKSAKSKKTMRLNEKDLNIALSYLLNHYIFTTSQITVNADHLQFKITLLLNKNILGKYINFSFNLTKEDGYPVIQSLDIGRLFIANELAGRILKKIIKNTPLKEYFILASQHVTNIQIENNKLVINYITPDDLELKGKLSLNNSSFRSVLFYQQLITKVIAQHDPKTLLSLAELLQPLFKSASQRSTLKNAIAENRAVLIAISTYVNKKEIQPYIPFNISPATNKQYPAFMYKRQDMAKHFMASAVLAASGAESFAYTLGQEKELNDAKRGSGFSFVDLAGDRAGLRFGKTAVASAKQAKILQQHIANIKDYTTFMPEVRDLPENMNDIVFKQKYQSVYSPNYQKMLEKIDQRISALPIYQNN
jgi:uncharacterized protein YfiM (DUF2279 family)